MISRLLPYQKLAIDDLCETENIARKKNLEIGGDPKGEVAAELIRRGDRQVVSINNRDDLASVNVSGKHQFINMDARNLQFINDSFDVVFGVSVLEHLNELNIILEEIFKVIKPNGLVYLHGGALWSPHLGHHVWVECEEKKYEFNGNNPVPDWHHLIFNKFELKKYLISNGIQEEHADKIVWWIYDHSILNRYRYEDHIKIFNESKFFIFSLKKEIWKKPSRKTLYLLFKFGNPRFNDYESGGIKVILKKKTEHTQKSEKFLFSLEFQDFTYPKKNRTYLYMQSIAMIKIYLGSTSIKRHLR